MPDILYPNPLGLPTCQRCGTLIAPPGLGPRCWCAVDRAAFRARLEAQLAEVNAEIAKRSEN